MAIPGQRRSKLRYAELLKAIATRTYLPEDTVRLVLDTLRETVKDALKQELDVTITRFGTFISRSSRQGGFEGLRIGFKSSAEFKADVKETLTPMDKYSVEMNNEATLLAKVTGECPDCKSPLDQKDPPHCPKCGTKPFEQKETP